MAEEGKFETAEKTIRTAYSRFGVVSMVIGLLALLGTIIGVVIVLRSEKTEISAQVLASDELTTYHPELEASFIYAGEEVEHLWKIKVRFINSGDKTIVGLGDQKNILGDGLDFFFPDETRILRLEEEADTFHSTIIQPEANRMQIEFGQWRSGEYSIVSLCIAADEQLDADPFPGIRDRDIIDGMVIIEDLTERRPTEKTAIIERLPVGLSTSGKIIGGIIAGGVALATIIFIFWAWIESIPRMKWKRRHLDNFVKHVERIKPRIPIEDRRLLKKAPFLVHAMESELPEGFWDKFQGPKPPEGSEAFDNLRGLFSATLIGFLFLFGCISLLLVVFKA